MSRSKLWLTAAFLLFIFAADAVGQKKKPTQAKPKQTPTAPAKKQSKPAAKPKPDPAKEKVTKTEPGDNEQKVRDMIAFLEFVLNTLGSSSTSSRDKDVLVTESYTKIFRDSIVQVEDDLDEAREVITNKDVQAYLKDVDFFFKDAKFEFVIEDLKSLSKADGQLYYKVSLTRHLKATTTEGEQVNNSHPRFVEINFDPKDQDLKIVSIYTNEFNERDALKRWWDELSMEWQAVLSRGWQLPDSVGLGEIRRMVAVEAIDITGNTFIQSIEPLSQLRNLRILRMAGTGISDLGAIRNLTELEELDLSGTKVTDLSALKYATRMARLDIHQTAVADLSIIGRMTALRHLDISSTAATDLSPLATLTQLQHVNVSSTRVRSLSPIEGLPNVTSLNASRTPVGDLTPIRGFRRLVFLYADSTQVDNLSPLSTLDSIRLISLNYTRVANLGPLDKLKRLEKVYCDQTGITRGRADAFMSAHPDVLVINDSKDLQAWWTGLSKDWQEVFVKVAKVGADPTKEELAALPHIDSINLSGRTRVDDLEPLRKLPKLQVVIVRQTGITDLSPLGDLPDIRVLDISDTQVADVGILRKHRKLRTLLADSTKIQDITPLTHLPGLQQIYVDDSGIHDLHAQEFLQRRRDCLLVYKTFHVTRWWSRLPESWKAVFRSHIKLSETPTREQLHQLVELKSIQFSDAPVSELASLGEFVALEALHFSGTAITDFSTLPAFTLLQTLHATNSPIRLVDDLTKYIGLEDLDLSNTPLDDATALGSLGNLKKLNIAGTQIRSLKDFASLTELEYLDCSNTPVNKLDGVFHLPLKALKCYNTKMTSRRIEEYSESHPDCSVTYYR